MSTPQTDAATPDAATDVRPYDALLLVSFGGPEKPEDVVPFLRNVTAGKDIPDARLEQVGSTTTPSAAAARSTTRTAR